MDTKRWLSASEAMNWLDVRQQTLYAYVSRGRIRARPDPDDVRRSLYHRLDVERLAKRQAGRHSAASVAADAIAWGEPVLSSGVSTVADGRLYYRGVDAVAWSAQASLEDTAGLLWQCAPPHFDDDAAIDTQRGTPLSRALLALAVDMPLGADGNDRDRSIEAARRLISRLAHALLGPTDATAPLHERLAEAWRVPRATDLLRRALVLLADHELNTSTFTARVAVSAGASLQASLLAGLCALSGTYHGAAGLAAWDAIRRVRDEPAERAIESMGLLDTRFPAFGHPLYPQGDERATALLAQFTAPSHVQALQAQLEAHSGDKPNIDFALAALAETFGLDDQAPMTIFTLARSIGWIAHALEQIESGTLIRPRARYTGDLPRA
ncbi:MAG TPA: citrate synthase family protein [Dyella sp.]|uniref:citrate synthase family protein n=1 Tax=Dyella sp. TaxID=1869338 RepID=UPI002F95747E